MMPSSTTSVVCIGASAGGLEPLLQLFRALPEGRGFAYVVIQHLDPMHDSQLVHLLSAATSMPVLEATQGTVASAGHVYVIPPNRELLIAGGLLELKPRGDQGTPHLPIDAFLRSLACDLGAHSVAVILSGGGEDGSLGVSEIHAVGGITFAQDSTAEHGEMPGNAIATGHIDLVLSPQAIAVELMRIARHGYLDRAQPDDAANVADAPPCEGEATDDQLQRILGIIRTQVGMDFSGYRTAMPKRRIGRRMALRDRLDVAAYIKDVESDQEEARRLVNDLMIGVTGFFRDPEVFATLRAKILPELIRHKSDKDTLRIWIAGCSTGEEVYSLAMDTLDLCTELGRRPIIQIFATDINEAAVAKARVGQYPSTIASSVSAVRLTRYFAFQDGGYRVDKELRDLCVFARHNLSVDTPFSRIDLISCRNVLIYFKAAMQERVLATFHHALAATGMLLLGTSESISETSHLFRSADAKIRLFSKVTSSQRQVSLATLISTVAPVVTAGVTAPSVRTTAATSAEVRKEADRIVLDRFSPAGVVVDSSLSIMQFRGNIGPYLAPSQGRASLELLRVIHPSLMHTLEKILAQARDEAVAIRTHSMWFPSEGGMAQDIYVEAVPVRIPATIEVCFLILFEDSASPRQVAHTAPAAVDHETADGHEMPWLRQELLATKQYLSSVIEQHDIASERMQLASDDHQSANEELRVTNEELQTAKEEQESANEEMATLLEELRRRNHELTELNDDLANLLEKITIPVVILGGDLRIRRLTATARSLIPGGAEVGRPISDLGRSFDAFELDRAAREVVESGVASEHEVRDQSGTWRAVRIFPYEVVVGGDRRTHGAVITVLDIDRLKRSEITFNLAAGFTRSIVETIAKPIIVLDQELRVVMANHSFNETFRLQPEKTNGLLFAETCDGEWRIPGLLEKLTATLNDHVPLDSFQVGRTFPTIGYRMLTLSARRLQPEGDGQPMVIVSMTDLTEHMRLEVESRRFKFISERSSDCHLLFDHAGRYAYANRSACELLRSSYEELISLSAEEVAAQWPNDGLRPVRRDAMLTPVPLFEALLSTRDGRRVFMEGSATSLDLGDSHYVLLSMRDVGERKRAEKSLAVTSENLRRSNDDLDRFAAIASHDLQEPLRMISSYVDLLKHRYGPQLDAKARGYIEHARDGATRLGNMVKAILQYSRVEATAVREKIDTGKALGIAIANLEQQIALAEAHITYGTLPTVVASPYHLDLVFQNLVANAIKYRAPGRAPIVTISAEHSEAGWTFSVADNGVGIAANDFNRMFEMFQRLDTKLSEGSGIGLATCKKIINNLGGRIWLTSELGVGTTFCFTVPDTLPDDFLASSPT